MSRPIHISLGPNYEKDDVFLALKILFKLLKWNDKQDVEGLEQEFEKKFPGYRALAINSGRSAQYLILKALDIGKGDEVIYQKFTCIAVPNSISWVGATPLAARMGANYNIDPADLESKISKKTKAVIIQNTFGIPAKVDVNGPTVVYDQAHSLGIKNVGKTAYFSFGRDKIISSVFGGMIITSDIKLFNRLKRLRDELPDAPVLWIVQQLLHPILVSGILPVYSVGLGKLLLYLLQKINILSRAVYPQEKRGIKPREFPRKMPGALAILARNQLSKLERFNKHRKSVAQYYFKHLNSSKLVLPPSNHGAVWLRFPVGATNGPSLIEFAKRRGVVLGDWYKDIDPNVVNLPTYPNMTLKDAQKVVQLVKLWTNTQ